MGNYIHFCAAPDHIRRSDWEAAFEDALQIAKKGQLCSAEQRSYEGHVYNVAIPAGEDEFCRTAGLEVSGELQTGNMMEPHFIPRSFGVDEPKENGNESILALYLDEYAPPGITMPETVDILYNKTQSTVSHIWLLAMVCVFCDRFPDAACVMGNVTAGQIGQALQIAEDVLGRKLLPPLAYDMDRLLASVRLLADGDEVTAAKLFFMIYCGPKNGAFIEFVVRSFTADAVYAAFRIAADRRGIYGILWNWLLLDKPFEETIRILAKRRKAALFAPEDFVRAILEEKVHVREITVDDAFSSDQCNEPLDEIGLLLLRVYIKMLGLQASAVERFIPLEQIKASSPTIFGDRRDADHFSSETAGAPERDDAEELYWTTEETMKDTVRYSMTKLESLFLWTPSDADNVSPALYEKLSAFLHMAFEATETIWAEFLAASRDDRIEMLIRYSENRFLLPEAVWIKLFEHVMEEVEMRRYIALFGAPLEERDNYTIARLFLNNETLYDHIRDTDCST